MCKVVRYNGYHFSSPWSYFKDVLDVSFYWQSFLGHLRAATGTLRKWSLPGNAFCLSCASEALGVAGTPASNSWIAKTTSQCSLWAMSTCSKEIPFNLMLITPPGMHIYIYIYTVDTYDWLDSLLFAHSTTVKSTFAILLMMSPLKTRRHACMFVPSPPWFSVLPVPLL